MSDQAQPPQMSEEEMRALEAELERITVDDVLLQTVVSLINLGARKGAVGAPPEMGLTPDYPQLKLAIDGARALMGLLEPLHGDKLGQVRDAISQLQLAYAQGAGGGGAAAAAPAPGGEAPPKPDEPPKSSGRLWVPGQ